MLINGLNLKKKYGAIHVGAHEGQERDFYKDFTQVIYFEPNKMLFDRLEKNIAPYPHQKAFNLGVHDYYEKAVLNISNNDGQSSSILQLGLHSIYHPDVKYVETVEINMTRLDLFFIEHPEYCICDFNFLNIDVQGVELNVIKSMGKLLSQLDYIYCEVNDAEVYRGCSQISDIDDYVRLFGFKRVHTKMTRAHWGDALYAKTELIS